MSSANLSNMPSKAAGGRSLADVLLEQKWVSEDDLRIALEEAQKVNQPVGVVLVRRAKLTRDDFAKAKSLFYNLNYVGLAQIKLDPRLIDLLPEEFMREKQVIPVSNAGGRLVIAMVDPSDRSTFDEITFITGMRPQAVVTTEFDFLEFCQKHLNDSAASNLLESMTTAQESGMGSSEEESRLKQRQEAEASDQSNPLVKLVNSIIQEGIEANASDIHVEPRRNKYVVRFRVDGILKHLLDIPQNMESSFVTRIKVMAQMDIADHRRPQDGRISIKYKNSEYNLRVNTLPVAGNREKIVIRILRPSKNITDFPELGFNADDIQKLETLYKSPYGIMLVCGPTGSGKTTTLYTILHKINNDLTNISTVEDPVELTIEGLNQSQVNPKADFTFATSLRALLRQDPDVIMVGEIRDYETLEAAIHAALTGHLVFSTIHSNSTAATITRMIEMGASTSLIASALKGVVAQRLIRSVCPHCKAPYKATAAEKKILFPYDENRQQQELALHRGRGCDMCNNTGYLGRIGLYEILMVDREIQQLITNSSSDLEIEDAAISSGMKTLAMRGREKVLLGESTLDEVIRVMGVSLGG
ncbi:MAG: ATPase, T2SS/T4P/T4SS family [Candidatus Melainabacteria bacterium]|nr:ATPase, T2SS/T4P/T4SS family [Candidatus Melainabacteria bacterium]